MARIGQRRPWNAGKARQLGRANPHTPAEAAAMRAARAKLRADEAARKPAACALVSDTTGERVCRLCHVRIDVADLPEFECRRGREPA